MSTALLLLDARPLLQTFLVVEEGGGQEAELVHGPAQVVVDLLAVELGTKVIRRLPKISQSLLLVESA